LNPSSASTDAALVPGTSFNQRLNVLGVMPILPATTFWLIPCFTRRNTRCRNSAFESIFSNGSPVGARMRAPARVFARLHDLVQLVVDRFMCAIYHAHMERRERTPLQTVIFHSGMRQVVIAQKTGITEARLSKIANGYIAATADEMKRLARVLRVPVPDLFPEVTAGGAEA
jgi:DNA-binding Xre family transcriptional regulator